MREEKVGEEMRIENRVGNMRKKRKEWRERREKLMLLHLFYHNNQHLLISVSISVSNFMRIHNHYIFIYLPDHKYSQLSIGNITYK